MLLRQAEMPEPQHSLTTVAPMALAPRPKQPFFQRREDYPIVQIEGGEDRIVMPIRDYRKFRGEASFWQFLCLCSLATVIVITVMVILQPPTYVEKPFVVEKEVQVPVNTKCLVWCK